MLSRHPYRRYTWCAALAAGSVVACGGRPLRDVVDEQVTDVFGGTCGEWEISPPGAATKLVHMDCGEGLECRREVTVFPEESARDWYGRCLPPDAVCDVSDVSAPVPCPDERLSCHVGVKDASPGQCRYRCSVAQDCPDRFQSCEFGGCRFNTCDTDHECRGGHCEDRLCVHD